MRLKKLELLGFKSFADKTEFIFEPGVTAIVGPNGCGKSNVVDSIKWILGEQSVKSLRGTEMADVIFNGSAARKSLGFAEATMTFDNADRRLGLDVDEVVITRRVYRGGEGAYFLNKQPCRLKDIKNLLLDTGMGMQCYSVIEQGKIDQILVSSTVERRRVFDEAAGISKYKARRKEAQAKLERVEQNLQRLGDIVEEVEKQLRSVKYQAAKARKYREYVDELKKLRTSYSLAEYDGLSKQSEGVVSKLTWLENDRVRLNTEAEQTDAAKSEIERKALEVERSAEDAQARLAEIRRMATAAEESMRFNQQRIREQADLQSQWERQVVSLGERVTQMKAEVEKSWAEIQAVANRLEDEARLLRDLSDEFSRTDVAAREVSTNLEGQKAAVVDLMQQNAKLENELSVSLSERRRLGMQIERHVSRMEEVKAEMLTGEQSIAQAALEIDAADKLLASLAEQSGAKQAARRDVAATLETLIRELNLRRQKREGLQSRLDLLSDLDEKLDGVEQGVRDVLAAMRSSGAAGGLRGMLGEQVKMASAHARAVEAALGHRAQTLVVDDLSHAVDGIKLINESGQGRASFLPLSHVKSKANGHELPAGTMGRLSDLVETDEAHRGVVEAMLANALLVEDLAKAIEVKAAESNGWTLVTLAGEVIEPTGVITGGKGISGGGIIRRAAERRGLETELAGLAAEIASLEQKLAASRKSEAELAADIERLASLAETEKASRAAKATAIDRLRQRQAMLSNEQQILAGERAEFEREAAHFDARAAELRTSIDAGKREDAELENRIKNLTMSHEEISRKRLEMQEKMTDLKVTLARTKQQDESARTAVDALSANLRVREEELGGLAKNIEEAKRRQAEAREEIAKRQTELTDLQQKEADQQKSVLDLTTSREGLRDETSTLENTAREIKKRLSDLDVELGQLRLNAQELKLKMENLATRVKEDFQLDLVEMHKTWVPEQMNWEEVAGRIEELRLKVQNMGNVNLDAIESEDALANRSDFLHGQRNDLNEAKRQLTEIIDKLNKESLEMFQKSFGIVREHFQEMFRKLFGGGKADIFLENEADLLESGIEIIARPPGKEPRSISLLSGGEKVMTAVALLFAIFKSRPSPFCVLDEVDAALDEANIGRFTSIVQDFLAHSQFIIVTHSKRTMSVANVIYGITMQESGVSKRISVKFEDYEQQVA